MIGDPLTIAKVRSNVLGRPAKMYSSPVISLLPRRRRLGELVVGTDRQGLTIYDVSTGDSLASYDLPIDSTFACAPISRRDAAQRHTYCALTEPSRRIYAFINTGIDVRVHSVPVQEDPCFLDVLSMHDTPYLIAVQSRGQVTCHNTFLDQISWTTALQVDSLHISCVEVIDFDEAKRHFSLDLQPQDSLLVVLATSQKPTRAILQIYRITPDSLHLLSSVPLSPPSPFARRTSLWTLDVATSCVLQQTRSGLVSYSLNGIQSHSISFTSVRSHAVLPLPQGFIATAGAASIVVVDSHLSSLQGERGFDGEERIRLLHFFQEEGLLVGQRADRLFSLIVSLPIGSRKRKRGLLVDALGQGSFCASKRPTDGESLLGSVINQEWSSEKLDELVTAGKYQEFDDLMLQELNSPPNDAKVQLLLKHIFSNAEIRFWPPRSGAWLIQHGLLFEYTMIHALVSSSSTRSLIPDILDSDCPLDAVALSIILKSLLSHHQPLYSHTQNGDVPQHSTASLTLLLKRARSISLPELVAALRSKLSRQELLHLVDLARIEIAAGGWLDSLADSRVETPADHLNLLVHLLNGCVDAIGLTGWAIETSKADPADLRLSHMKAEISAALLGIQEARYLQGILGQVLSGACGPMLDDGSLPVDLRAPPELSLTKTSSGGPIRRSARDIGRLKSQAVDRYQRERIEV